MTEKIVALRVGIESRTHADMVELLYLYSMPAPCKVYGTDTNIIVTPSADLPADIAAYQLLTQEDRDALDAGTAVFELRQSPPRPEGATDEQARAMLVGMFPQHKAEFLEQCARSLGHFGEILEIL